MTNRSSSHRWVYFFIQNGFAANASILSYFKGSWGFCIGSHQKGGSDAALVLDGGHRARAVVAAGILCILQRDADSLSNGMVEQDYARNSFHRPRLNVV